ncbi:CTL-like protein 1 isoform X2 [Limulus polyphemus]|uniref:Choline transporter-like protein n=1 Tax=Limulus polyphemus TaxID=6850 RepID=A0ABM1TB20_LIMPO|nr:CTL-like protein 1 isoform X2 [Limulus polyphemus]
MLRLLTITEDERGWNNEVCGTLLILVVGWPSRLAETLIEGNILENVKTLAMSICCVQENKKSQGCTDVIFLVVFVIFWVILIFIAAFAFVTGNPLRLMYGYDSFGNICGVDNKPVGNLSYSGLDMTDKPYLFYFDVTDLSHSLMICVKKCPDRILSNIVDLQKFKLDTGSSLHRYDIDEFDTCSDINLTGEGKGITSNSGLGPCPKLPVYAMKPLLHRCVPESVLGITQNIIYSFYSYLNSFDTFQQVVGDLYASWKEMLGMLILSVVLSFVMVFLIHFVAAVVSWIIMAVIALASIALTGILWWTYLRIKWGLDSTPFFELLEEAAKNERAFLIYAVLVTILTVCLLLILIILRKRVELMVALFHEAGKCVRAMPCLLLQPIFTFIVLGMFFIFWLGIVLTMATADYPTRTTVLSPLLENSGEPSSVLDQSAATIQVSAEQIAHVAQFTTIKYNEPAWVHHQWWYLLIALVWTSEFILGCQQMVIAGATSSWYFQSRNELHCPIGKSVLHLISYHLGSVALGSFLITIFKVPRIVLSFMKRSLKKYENNVIASCCYKCCSCCLWCLEKFIRYLNHNAYTVVAIRGTGFCHSAQSAFNTLVTNALRVATINSVGDFILFLGKCAVTVLTACVGILVMMLVYFHSSLPILCCLYMRWSSIPYSFVPVNSLRARGKTQNLQGTSL